MCVRVNLLTVLVCRFTKAEAEEAKGSVTRLNIPDVVRSFVVYFDRQVAEKVCRHLSVAKRSKLKHFVFAQ